LFRESLKQHFEILQLTAGQTISYTDGSTVVSGIVAVRTLPKANQLDDTDGIIFGSKSWTWLIAAGDLEDIEPSLGHVITDADGVTYKVQPSNPNDLPYRWSDGFETYMEIRTEQQS